MIVNVEMDTKGSVCDLEHSNLHMAIYFEIN